VWAELFYNGAWNTITDDLRVTTSAVTITRGLTSESAAVAAPTACSCDLDSRDYKYAPRNPISPLYGLIGRNTPMRLGYTAGSPWALMTGTAGNELTTPDNASLLVTDLDLRVDLALEDWQRGQKIAGRYSITGENRSWALVLAGTGQLGFYWSPDGTVAARIIQFSTIPVVAYNGQRQALRVTLDVNNGAGGYELRFYTGRTVDDIEWNLLGDPIVGAATTAVFDGTAGIELGDTLALVDNAMAGKLFAFKLLNGIGGTVAASMTTTGATPGASSFTSGGVLWTVAGAASLTSRHVRMAGEVPAWPPTRDLSGNDNYVSVNPTGVMRRMDAGNKPQDSALLRYIKVSNPVECWPLTDGPTSTGARSLVGGADMMQEILVGTDTAASWAGGRLADWIEPTLSVKANTSGYIRGACRRTTGTDAFWSVDLFLSGGGTPSSGQFTLFDRGAATDSDNRISIEILFTGSLDRLTVIRTSQADNSSSQALLANVDNVGIYNEDPHHIRLSVDPQASSTLWYLYVDGTLRANGTIATIVMKSLRNVLVGWGFATLAGVTMTDRSLGYLTYWDGTGPSAAAMYEAYMGFRGEKAGARIERLATEAGYTASIAGESVYQRPMGIQGQKKLLELMNEAAVTNFGYLLDARDRIEVIHRGQSTLWNQTPALTLDFSAGLISPPFKPVDDDKLTENDVSVKREFGASPARDVLDAGDLSVLDPEQGGVGRYDRAYTYSLDTDEQAAQVAGMRVHLGTYDGVRYTRITLNLANSRVYALIDDILRVDVGDKIRLTDLPPDHGPDDVDVLVVGYTEEAGPDAWLITFTCVPGEPWTAGVVGSHTYRADTSGSSLAAAATATATSLSVATDSAAYAPWTTDHTDTPFDLRVGGEVVTVVSLGTVINDDPLLRNGVASWVGNNATIALTTLPTRVNSAYGAAASISVAPNGSSASGGVNATAISGAGTVTAGASYTACGWFFSPGGWSDLTTAVDWHDAAGTYLSSGIGTSTAVPAGVWTFLSFSFTAPASSSRARMRGRYGSTPSVADVFYVWNLRLIANSSVSTTSPQTMTVIRSVNGVSKAHASGQDIRLAHPAYVGM
jgi:hypothetical protein